MITVLNRKELFITMEMNRQAKICDILSQNGIDYIVKTTNPETAPVLGNRRAHTGSFGLMNIKSMFIKRTLKRQRL